MQRDRQDGVTLADGTRLEDLIDRRNRTLLSRVHTDPEVFELELEQIFARAWIPVAHVSEFRHPGDFVSRYIGRDAVLVSIDEDGAHHVMLNVCTHRGGRVCSAEGGNARTHMCPFHGWTFGDDGRLMGVPHERQIYGQRFDRNEFGLRHARVGVAGGLVFATWDETAPELDEFIGDFKFYLDAMMCRTDAGLEVSGPPQRYVVDANWKVVVDGFYGDGYHVPTVHKSFVDIDLYSRGEAQFFKASINGHGMLCFDFERMLGIAGDPAQVLTMLVPPGTPPELLGELERNLSQDQIALLAQTPPSVGALFPATALLQIVAGPSSPIGVTVEVRFFVPLSPEQTEIVSFSLVERDALQEFKDRVHKTSIGSFGVGGMFESDDVEVWAGVQRGVQGVIGRRMRENYQAVAEPYLDPDRPGVTKYRGTSSDDNQWLFYERYFDFLEGRAW